MDYLKSLQRLQSKINNNYCSWREDLCVASRDHYEKRVVEIDGIEFRSLNKLLRHKNDSQLIRKEPGQLCEVLPLAANVLVGQ